MTRAFLALVLCLTASAVAQQPAADKLVYPVIPKVGGVAPLPDAAEHPRKGAKVVFEITADAKPADLNKGVERVARLLNLYGSAGLKASDVKIAMVMHGDATKSALSDAAYKERFGVEVFVCGQALAYKGFKKDEVSEGINFASAALTVVINKQADGYSYVPAH